MNFSAVEKTEYRAEHPPIMPVHQPHHRYARLNLTQYFHAIFDSDCTEYKGMVTVAAKDYEGNFKIVACVPAAELPDWAAQAHISTHLDYFYTRAQHRGHTNWDSNDAFAYNGIFVDIDAHERTVSPRELKYMVNLLCEILPDKNIAAPNIIEHSGRGIHLVWLIEQLPGVLDWLVKSVSKAYAVAVRDILMDHGFTDYSVDMAYAANINGLTRMPGSLNTSAGQYADYCMMHSHRVDAIKAYDNLNIPKATKKMRRQFRGLNAQLIGLKRIAALEELATMRGGISEGMRDLYLFTLFCCCRMAGFSIVDAIEKAYEVNRSFQKPLEEKTVMGYLTSAIHKDYKLSNNKIIELLGITDEEQAATGIRATAIECKRNRNGARDEKRRNARIKRDRNVMANHLMGYTKESIAAKLAPCMNTIKKVIAEYTGNEEQLFTAEELRRLRKLRIRRFIRAIKAVWKPVFSAVYGENQKWKTLYSYAYTVGGGKTSEVGEDTS